MPEVQATTNRALSRRSLLKRWWSSGAAGAALTASGAASALSQVAGFGQREAAHLLRRAGFGGTPEQVGDLVARGRAGAVDSLVDYENTDNTAMEQALDALVQDVPRGQKVDRGQLDLSRLPGIQAWWLYRMTNSARPLEEKMTLFWHGHFATAISKVTRASLMLDQNKLFRRLALGNFGQLLLEVSQDPAMILWLDNNTNIKGLPNENYGRELMELFSMGINDLRSGEPNYSEDDVKAVARAFTGWTLRRRGFFFNRTQHDDGSKTVFGHSGNFDGEDVVKLIVERDATAYFMANKLWEFFAYPNPETEVLDELAAVYQNSGHEMKAVVRHLFNMNAFYSDKALFGQIKSPTELVVGALRLLGIEFNDARGYQFMSGFMRTMDQELFNPPTVAGWSGGLDWVNTSTLLVRYNTANLITSFSERALGKVFEPGSVTGVGGGDPEQIVDALLSKLGPLEVSEQTRFSLLDYLTDGDLGTFSLDGHTLETKVRGLAHLVLTLPEYQLN